MRIGKKNNLRDNLRRGDRFKLFRFIVNNGWTITIDGGTWHEGKRASEGNRKSGSWCFVDGTDNSLTVTDHINNQSMNFEETKTSLIKIWEGK